MLEKIPIEQVQDNPFQPRQDYPGIEELAANIKAMADDLPDTLGLIHVPNARRLEDGTIQLAEGHRRLRAFRHLAEEDEAFQEIPINIISLDDIEMDNIAWSENQHRKDLNPIEEALALQRTMETRNLKQNDLAKLRKLARSTVANKLRLLTLPDDMQQAIREGQLSERLAVSYLPLLKIKEADLKTASSRLRDVVDYQSWETPTPGALKRRLIEKDDLSANDVRRLVKKIQEAVERAKQEAWEREERERQRQAEAAARAEAAKTGEGDEEKPDWLQPAAEGEAAGQQSEASKPEPGSTYRLHHRQRNRPRRQSEPDPLPIVATISITRKAGQALYNRPRC